MLTQRGVSTRLKGKFYTAYIQGVLIETWTTKEDDMNRLRSERAIVRWMCGITL